jgi:hypothetical protein
MARNLSMCQFGALEKVWQTVAQEGADGMGVWARVAFGGGGSGAISELHRILS